MIPDTLQEFLVYTIPDKCLFLIQKYLERPQKRELLENIKTHKQKIALLHKMHNYIYIEKSIKTGHNFHCQKDYTEIYKKLKLFIDINTPELGITLKNGAFLKKVFAGAGGATPARVHKIWLNLEIEEINTFILVYNEELIREWYFQIPIHNNPVPYKWMYMFNTPQTNVILDPYSHYIEYYRPSDLAINMICDM